MLLVAVNEICCEAGTVVGAVYVPSDLTVPTMALPLGMPFTLQETEESGDPGTLATNVLDVPTVRLAVPGLMITPTCDGSTMTKSAGAELAPPRVGLTTVTVDSCAVRSKLGGMIAVSCVGDTYVVFRSAPLNITTDVGNKLSPLTVRVKDGPFISAVEGAIAVNVGASLSTVAIADAVLLGSALAVAVMW